MLPGLLPRYILEFEFFNEPTLWNRLQKHLIFFLSLSNYLAVKGKIYLVRFCNLLNTGFGWFGWIPHLQTAVATLVYWIKIRKINNSSIFNTIKAWNNKTYIQLWTERIAPPALLWSKTTQTTGGVDRTWEDPPTCKMGTFFLMPLTLTEPSLNNFQLNGAILF